MAASLIDSLDFGDTFTNPAMRHLFSDEARFRSWLDVEAALARTQARLGLIPVGAAEEISRAAVIKRLDFRMLEQQIDEVIGAVARLARDHRDTVMAGRTFQHPAAGGAHQLRLQGGGVARRADPPSRAPVRDHAPRPGVPVRRPLRKPTSSRIALAVETLTAHLKITLIEYGHFEEFAPPWISVHIAGRCSKSVKFHWLGLRGPSGILTEQRNAQTVPAIISSKSPNVGIAGSAW
nr:hypothetical protein [Thiocapsa imhoffii]